MNRLPEVELTDRAVKFAGEYIEQKFKSKSGTEVQKSLILNSIAHGYFMGGRFIEDTANAPKWKFWIKRLPLSAEELTNESIKASSAYIKAKNLHRVEWSQLMLIKASVAQGFEKGAREREQST